MRRLTWFAGGLLVMLLLVFAAVEAAGVPLLTDPRPALREAGAVAGVALLVADVVVPVPASIVMTAHGAAYGVVAGSLLSLAGGTGAALAGWLLGRRATVATSPRAERLVHRWGLVAVVVTRPVPLLAETVAVVAGATRLPWRRVVVAAALGTLPAAIGYAVAGAHVASR